MHHITQQTIVHERQAWHCIHYVNVRQQRRGKPAEDFKFP